MQFIASCHERDSSACRNVKICNERCGAVYQAYSELVHCYVCRARWKTPRAGRCMSWKFGKRPARVDIGRCKAALIEIRILPSSQGGLATNATRQVRIRCLFGACWQPRRGSQGWCSGGGPSAKSHYRRTIKQATRPRGPQLRQTGAKIPRSRCRVLAGPGRTEQAQIIR